jgi:lipopolysaccharide export system permease protein
MASMALSAPGWRGKPWRPALLDGYILKMLAAPAVAVLGVTLVAFLLEQTLRLIDQLSANGARLSYLFGLVANLVPYQLGLALPASFFVAMFIVIARLDEESEIDALLAGGVSFERIVAPLLFAGVILGVLSLLLLGYLQPYSRFGYRAVLNAATEAGWTARLDPQVFLHAGPDFTISADDVDATGRTLKGVFIRRTSKSGETVVTASGGTLGLRPDGKTTDLTLNGGLILTDTAKGGSRLLRFGDFTDHEMLKGGAALAPRGGDVQELTFPELVSEISRRDALIPKRELKAELYARLARSFAIPLLPLLALPLALAAKRGRRAPGMIVGAVILVAFHHGVTLCKSLAASGKVDPLLSIGGLFLGMTVFGVWLFMSSRRRPGETPISGLLARMETLFQRREAKTRPASVGGSLSLSAYLTRMMTVRTAAAAAALMGLLQLIDLLERTSDILARGGPLGILRYMTLRLPFMFVEVAPFAVLAGAIFTFSQLARNSELVVMRITGLSLFQIFRRTLPVALVVAGLDLVVADQVTPRAQQELAAWWTASAPATLHKASSPHWFRIDGDVVMVQSASSDGKVLHGVAVYERNGDKALTRRLSAVSATPEAGGWRLHDAAVTDLLRDRASSMTMASTDWRTSLTPHDATALFAGSYEVTSNAAYRALIGQGPLDKSPSQSRTRLYRTLAEALSPLVMLLLALPASLGYPRSNKTAPVVFGLGCGLLYLVTDGLLTAMGSTGVLPPLAAAWGAPAVFTAGAITVLLYAEG